MEICTILFVETKLSVTTSFFYGKENPKTQFPGCIISEMIDRPFQTGAVWTKEADKSPMNSQLNIRSFPVMTGAGSVCTKGTHSYMGKQIYLC